jgi:hypothetical protein
MQTAEKVKRFALRMSREISRFGQCVSVYTPAATVLTSLDSVDAPYALAGATSMLLQRDALAADMAFALGVLPSRVSWGYFPVEVVLWLVDRGVVSDAKGRYWLIHQLPITAELTSAVGVKVLLELLLIKPNGLP